MARPPKNDSEKLCKTVKLRLTEAEQDHVRLQARVAGITVSDYLRRRALEYVVPNLAGDRRVDPALVSELNRIGVNINQIARNMNAGRPERLPIDLALAELRGVFDKVLRASEA